MWTPVPGSVGMTLSYELRLGGTRPGPKDAWDRFDRVVARLGVAMEGESASAVAGALSDLAGAIETRPARVPGRPANRDCRVNLAAPSAQRPRGRATVIRCQCAPPSVVR